MLVGALFKVNHLSLWARSNGLVIVLLAVGAVLLTRLVSWCSAQASRYLENQVRAQVSEGLVPSEHSKHARALVQAGEWAVNGLVFFVAALLVLVRFGVPLTTLVAPATVAGVALGFGAQRVVQDLLAGFFLFAERQYGFGDVVRLSVPGQTPGTSGTVEELTLRTTKLRTVNGELVIIPNGQIVQATNLSRDWSRVVIDIPLPADYDLDEATELLRGAAEEITSDDGWKDLLLEEPTVLGVESIDVGFYQLRLTARTLPAKQWEVGRELRRRIALAFQRAGIEPPRSVLANADESV